MNIFYLAHEVNECAAYHVNSHIVKMPTELSQILCTAHRVIDGDQYQTYSDAGRRVMRWKMRDPLKENLFHTATHVNHPSSVWARHSKQNYDYLYSLFVALCNEYTRRYGKTYKAFREELGVMLQQAPIGIADRGFTQPTPAMPVEFIVPGDSIASYRNYYRSAKTHLHTWKTHSKPEWL